MIAALALRLHLLVATVLATVKRPVPLVRLIVVNARPLRLHAEMVLATAVRLAQPARAIAVNARLRPLPLANRFVLTSSIPA